MKSIIKSWIEETAGSDYTHGIPIEEFSGIEEVSEAVELCRTMNINVTLFAEHSNFHQGVLFQMKEGKR